MEQKNKRLPLVSVIMPAYNAEKYIAKAIQSVLDQGVLLELIIVIDKAGDKTLWIAQEFATDTRVMVIENEENLGVAESRNVGIRLARGKYIAFLDADDWWDVGKLKHQCARLEKTKKVLCCSGRELMKANGSSMAKQIGVPKSISYAMLLRTNLISCSSVVLKANVAKEFEMCHDELHEDYILWLKVLKKYGPVEGINKPYLKSRMSEQGKSRNKLKSAQMQWGVYRYMKIGRLKSIWYFINYSVNGVLKYRG
jgi:teichuronic acid biosynthesis glycosyltransferase TuaG